MASSITFGGLASGLDTNSIIDKLVQVERQPLTALQTQRQQASTQKDLVQSIADKLAKLDTALQGIQNPSDIQGRAVSVPTGAPFTAEVSGGAPMGNYSIIVDQLAHAQRTYSDTFAASDADLSKTGNITLTIGATTKTVAVKTGDTLSQVAQHINDAGLGLSAAVVYDGSKYRLVLNGSQTGQKNAINITDTSGLGLDKAANTVLSAQDAVVQVDGIKVLSSTNSVTGIIPGVKLTLTGLSDGSLGDGAGAPKSKGGSVAETNIGVTEDPTRIKTQLNAVVKAYNDVIALVNKQFTSGGSGSSATQLGPDTLAGDSTTRQLQAALMGLPTTVGGPAGNTYSRLLDIGVSVDRYGVMSLDESRLTSALTNDTRAVTKMLTGDGITNGVVKNLRDGFKLYTDFVDGALPTKTRSIDSRMKTMDAEITRMDTAAKAYETQLRQQFNQMEQLISQYNSQTSSLLSLSNLTYSSSNK